MTKAIYFDMDGTIANLYGVEDWLPKLRAYDATPYRTARPLLHLSTLARYLNKLQRNGYKIGIVSWLSKNSNNEYDEAVISAKKEWLARHLASVHFDEIAIVPYGVPKSRVIENADGILFDDEEKNRDEWCGFAFSETEIFEILTKL